MQSKITTPGQCKTLKGGYCTLQIRKKFHPWLEDRGGEAGEEREDLFGGCLKLGFSNQNLSALL